MGRVVHKQRLHANYMDKTAWKRQATTVFASQSINPTRRQNRKAATSGLKIPYPLGARSASLVSSECA